MKQIGLYFIAFITLVGCKDMMHDAPKEENTRWCGNAGNMRRPNNTNIDGKALFQANCATCHNPIKDATGPGLQGVALRWSNNQARLYSFIRNSKKVIKAGDPYAVALCKKWDKAQMTSFPNLTDDEIGAILGYLGE